MFVNLYITIELLDFKELESLVNIDLVLSLQFDFPILYLMFICR